MVCSYRHDLRCRMERAARRDNPQFIIHNSLKTQTTMTKKTISAGLLALAAALNCTPEEITNAKAQAELDMANDGKVIHYTWNPFKGVCA